MDHPGVSGTVHGPRLRSTGVLLAAALALLASGCGQRQSSDAETIRISGSSTVFPIIERAQAAYTKDHGPELKVALSAVGTSGGLREFCQGSIPIANASRPISSAELKTCADQGVTFIELPLAFDALTVVVNGRNDWSEVITTKELARTWSRQADGQVTSWQQINIDWPSRALKLCGPGEDSGTFDYFNEAINGGKTNSRSDYQTSEDDAVIADCVASDPGAMGYFGYANYTSNTGRLKALAISPAGGIPVVPSVSSVQNGSYQPLSRPLFIYVNDRQMRSDDAIRRFVGYTVRNGVRFVEQAGYIPLPADTYRLVESKLYKHILGTSFGGDLPVGLSIDQALSRSFDATRREEFR